MTITIPDSMIEFMEGIEEDTTPLENLCDNISEGDTSRKEEGKVISEQKYDDLSVSNQKEYGKVIRGRNIDRFQINESGDYIKTLKDLEDIKRSRILVKDISNRLKAAYDDGSYSCLRTIYCVYPSSNKDIKDVKYVLAILNSNLMYFWYLANFYCSQMSPRKGNFRFREQFISRLPIKNIETDEEKRKKKKLVELVNKIKDLESQRSWIVSSFEILLNNLQLNDRKKLKYFFKPDVAEKYGLKLTDSKKFSSSEKAIPKEYKVKVSDGEILVLVRNKNDVSFEKKVKLSFKNSNMRDYFYTSLKLCEGKKQYRTEKDVLDTLMEDMEVPQSQNTNLIEENINQIKEFLNVLRNEYKDEKENRWKNSPVEELDLSKIKNKIEEVNKEIDEQVYNLYCLSEEEIEFVETYEP